MSLYQLRSINETDVQKAIDRYNLDPFFARLLVAKGFNESEIDKIINLEKALQPPKVLTHAVQAANSIATFIQNPRNAVFTFGDYDVDGIMSTYVLLRMIEPVAECPIIEHVPEREDGYGLNMEWCKKVVEELRNYNEIMVITVDNGIAQKKEIDFLQSHGITCIILDHHEPKEEVPNCLIVNPFYHNDKGAKHLCGTSVAFKVCQLIQDHFNINSSYDVIECVMLATIADMMPMTCENIAYCYFGLQKIKSPDCHLGIKRLIEKDGKDIQTIDYNQIGFSVNTKLNACGRVGKVNVALDLMKYQKDPVLADVVWKCNEERVQLATDAFEQLAGEKITSHIIACKTLPGICSAVINKVMKLTHCDTIVVTPYGDYYKGSGRAYTGNILAHVDSIAHQFETLEYGGHEEAIGIKISKKEFPRFRTAFDQTYKEQIDEVIKLIDFEIPFDMLNENIAEIVHSLPYSSDHETPIIRTRAQLTFSKPTKKNPNHCMIGLKKGDVSLTMWLENGASITKKLPFYKDLTVICTIEKPWKEGDKFSLKILNIEDDA